MLSALIWQNWDFGAMSVALAAVGLAAVLWLYPPQLRRSVTQRWRWMLPGLRALVILALAVSLLKPVASRPKNSTERGAVVLLVDQSQSMGVNDAGRSPAAKVALAEALGVIPVTARHALPGAGLASEVENLRELLERVWRARSEAEYARLSGRGVDVARQRLEQTSAELRTAAGHVAAHAKAVSAKEELGQRLAELRRLPPVLDEPALRDWRGKLAQMAAAVAKLQEQSNAAAYESGRRVRDACDELDRSSRIELARRAVAPPQGIAEKLMADGPLLTYGFADDVVPLRTNDIALRDQSDRTDIMGALRWARMHLRGQPVSAIVLVSDGRQSGSAGDVDLAAQDAGGPPVYTVGVARSEERRDVSITQVLAPASVFLGETATVRVDVHAVNCREQTLQVSLDAPEGRQTQRVTVGDATTLSVEFPLAFKQPGAVDLVASVQPVAGEATDLNNRSERWVKVVSENVSVLLVAGSPTREVQSISTALSSTPWISLQQSTVPTEDDLLLLSADQILQQSVVILCDVRSWSLGEAQWAALEQLVTERGGAVVFAVGDPDVLRGYAQHPLASHLLPFDPGGADVSWRVWPGDKPHYSLVPGAWSGAADSGEQPRWRTLSPVMAYVSMPQLNPNAQAILVERETNAPVLAEARFGLGRAYVLGTDETWRWRQPNDEQAFWQPLVRRAAEGPYAAHEGNHWLDVDEIAVRPGQPLHVRAKVLREDGSPSQATWQELQVVRDGILVRTVRLNPAFTVGPGRYEATLTDLSAGQYELRLSTGDDLAPAPRVNVRIAPDANPSSAELADLSGDERLLTRIAESSGGQYLRLQQIPSLPRRIAELRERQQAQLLETSLWDSPYLFLFVLAGLSLEWALRKRIGLA